MVRPKQCRYISRSPECVYFKPQGIPLRELQTETLALDEFEALRLADLEGLYHEECAQEMGVSRATFGRILQSAHAKVARALVEGKALGIEGGEIQMISKRSFICRDCSHQWEVPHGTGRPGQCPACNSTNLRRFHAEAVEGSEEAVAAPGGRCRQNRQRRQCRSRNQPNQLKKETTP